MMQRGQDVVVVGEAIVDIIDDGGGTNEVVGGSPLNVARALSRLDLDVRLVTQHGNDQYGQMIEDLLLEDGVALGPECSAATRTSTARVTLDPEGIPSYDIDLAWNLDQRIVLSPLPRALHVGSLAAFHFMGASTIDDLLAQRGSQTIVSYDPNVRADALGMHPAVFARHESLTAQADIVKLSDEDAEWLYPECDELAVANRLLALGPRLVVLTAGPRGALAVTRAGVMHLPVPALHVVDTIGAGDGFMAGLVYGALLVEDWETQGLRRVVSAAIACASHAVSARGAQYATHNELRRLLR